MGKIARAMETLDADDRNTVLLWIEEFYGRGKLPSTRLPPGELAPKIRAALAETGGMRPRQVADRIGLPSKANAVKVRMWHMAQAGELVSERGNYWLKDAMG